MRLISCLILGFALIGCAKPPKRIPTPKPLPAISEIEPCQVVSSPTETANPCVPKRHNKPHTIPPSN